MRNRCILMLETLEDRLPPVGFNGLADVASNPPTIVAKYDAPPLLIRTNLVQSLRSLAADFSVAPQNNLAAGGKSVAGNPLQLSVSAPLSVIEAPGDSKSELAGSQPKALIDVSWGNTAGNEVHNQISPPSNPTVTPPEFTGQWFITENADLNSLEHLVAGGANENGNTGGPQRTSGDDDSGGDWGYHIDNNDGYQLLLNTVTFSGPGVFTPVYRDIAQTEYAPPHWKDLDHNNKDDRTENPQPGDPVLPGQNMGEPVSYAMGKNMIATIDFDLHYIPPPVIHTIDPFNNDKNVWIRGIASYDMTKPPLITEVEEVGDPKSNSPGLDYTLTFSPLMSTVYHWADMTIEWQYSYSVANNPNWITFNKSHNANYVTLAKSHADKLYLTLADYSTLQAHGESTVAGTVSKMWAYVSNRTVYRSEDSHPLTYYGDWTTLNDQLSQLLADTDAQCGAWALFWTQSLMAHWITGASIKEVTATVPNERLLINNWDYVTALPAVHRDNTNFVEYYYKNEWSTG